MAHSSTLVRHLATAALLCTALVRADNINSGGQEGIIRCISARPMDAFHLRAGAALKYDRDYGYVSGAGGTQTVLEGGQAVSRESPQLLSGDIFVAYGLTRFWDVGLELPLYYDITGWDADRAGIGDLELAVKLALPLQRTDPVFAQALFCRLIMPTGADDRGYFPRHLYHVDPESAEGGDSPFTADDWLFNPVLAWSLHFDRLWPKFPIQFHANVGVVVADIKRNSVLTGAFGLEYSPITWLTLFGEVSGEALLSTYAERFSVRHFENSPLVVTPGVRVRFPFGLFITAAGDIGISSDKSEYRTDWNTAGSSYSTAPSPVYGAQVTIGWDGVLKERDSDGDGLIDKKDPCPQLVEDLDGFEDDDGCPEPDNDQDGIADEKDKCPNEAATCDGCPVYDADNDGIDDKNDKCPDKAEDMDGFEDSDGCPDPDNDQDGVPDGQDRCASSAEDRDGFEDDDGCPDMDNDRDGVADEWDKCPDVRGSPDNQGCPKTKEIQRGALVLKGVTFQSGKAVLTPNSFTVLNMVYESLAEWTEVRLEIQGHTDSQGSDAVNMSLSQKRAESVRNYLIRKGIDPARLLAVGYGEGRPIASNATADGRAQNRRVELHRTD